MDKVLKFLLATCLDAVWAVWMRSDMVTGTTWAAKDDPETRKIRSESTVKGASKRSGHSTSAP